MRNVEAVGLLLVLQHVGVAAAVTIINREGIAEEHALQPWVALYLLLGERFTATVSAEAGAGRERGKLVALVLFGPVDTPWLRIGGVFSDLHESHVWVLRF